MPKSCWFYYLWNPVIVGEGVRVPFTPPLPSRVMYRTGFVHDPYGSDYNHFKLVCPFRNDSRRWGFYVFDSGAVAGGGWAKMTGDDKEVSLADNKNIGAPFHMGGVLYWHLFGCRGGGCLLSFDPRGGGGGERIAGVVQPPPGTTNCNSSALSQQEDGHLTFFEFTNIGMKLWCLRRKQQQGGEKLYKWEMICSVRSWDAMNRHKTFFFSRCPFTSHLRRRCGGDVSARLREEHRIIHATCSPDKVYLRFRRTICQQQQQQRHIVHEFILTYDMKEDIWGQFFFPKSALAQDQDQFFYLHCSLLLPPRPKF